ncbi:hypothetical protein L596_025411 [Steinernema carpocapsae]|uniref:DNA2/NAM7 helicase-like C-terminal domain-containing protein n=1 Tax=Steinernema carpocapsae TaxID=34508 RepID=A0A4U5M7P1_STECR|nr:hypothetical protein L596_025411 [Steinernema carpocapsae]
MNRLVSLTVVKQSLKRFMPLKRSLKQSLFFAIPSKHKQLFSLPYLSHFTFIHLLLTLLIPAVYNLAKNFDLDVSLFERLINSGFPYAMLQNQHRMRPEIARALMPHFYNDLRDDPSVFQYPNVTGMAKNFLFINHNEREMLDEDGLSHLNLFEGEYAVRLARYLLQQGHAPSQITILSTYAAQSTFIKNRAFQLLGKDYKVRIKVLDNFQGDESDILILSLVRSHPGQTIGFLNVANRVCVALSRAKRGFYCLGNIDFFASKCRLWMDIKTSLKDSNALSNNLEIVSRNHGNSQASRWE